MYVSELETPALLIDLDVLERNLKRVADYAREHGLRLRPHTKTHKSPVVGRKQLDHGAVGLTVAKTGEAEVMLRAEPPDLLIAYPVIGRTKLERLMEVARRTQLTVALDSMEAARQLSEAANAAQVEVGVLSEVDAGMGRVGVQPGEDLLSLARGILQLPHLHYRGIAFYPGHIKDTSEASQCELAAVSELVDTVLADFQRAGIPVEIVSGGSTPALFYSHTVKGLTEMRPGTYVYNDLNTLRCGACAYEDCAASVMTTVVSTARKGQIIIDGGSKTFSSDCLAVSSEVTFGLIKEAPEAVFHRMNEEHGFVDISHAGRDFAIGERLHIIPNHVCVAVNLHENVYGVRDGKVEEVWRVEGRGKLQ